MGKSKKKTPIHSIAVVSAGAQGRYRKMWNKQLRQKLKEVETLEEAKAFRKIYGNEWCSPRDGKSYTKKPYAADAARYHEWYVEVFRK